MSTWRQFTNIWLYMAIYVGSLFLLIAAQMVLDSGKILSFEMSLPYFLIAHIVVMIACFYGLARSLNSPAIREAQDKGLAATAEILEAKWTGWRTPRRRRGIVIRAGNVKARRREYKLQVRVTPPDGIPYEATMFAHIEPSNEPKVGMMMPVKIHPKRPQIVVMADAEK